MLKDIDEVIAKVASKLHDGDVKANDLNDPEWDTIKNEEHSKKKKLKILIRDGWLVAVDENEQTLVHLFDGGSKEKLERCGYNTSGYKWNDDGSLR